MSDKKEKDLIDEALELAYDYHEFIFDYIDYAYEDAFESEAGKAHAKEDDAKFILTGGEEYDHLKKELIDFIYGEDADSTSQYYIQGKNEATELLKRLRYFEQFHANSIGQKPEIIAYDYCVLQDEILSERPELFENTAEVYIKGDIGNSLNIATKNLLNGDFEPEKMYLTGVATDVAYIDDERWLTPKQMERAKQILARLKVYEEKLNRENPHINTTEKQKSVVDVLKTNKQISINQPLKMNKQEKER